ncbi:MAG TPA: hypothetical protein VFB99_21740, partial [Vicinamibacterales bacterium]|nr:hypothetical protein [Vicinamibacterales bacterium]
IYLQADAVAGAASGFALSPDPEQRFLYMIDGANHHVWILNRSTLQVNARFGQQGLWDGFLNCAARDCGGRQGQHLRRRELRRAQVSALPLQGLGKPSPNTLPRTTIVQ